MTTRSKTSNARNRVPTATRVTLEALDTAQKDTLAQLATALERIGVLELYIWGGGPRTAQDVIAKQAEAEERNRVFEEQFRAAGGTVVDGPTDGEISEAVDAAMARIEAASKQQPAAGAEAAPSPSPERPVHWKLDSYLGPRGTDCLHYSKPNGVFGRPLGRLLRWRVALKVWAHTAFVASFTLARASQVHDLRWGDKLELHYKKTVELAARSSG